MLQDPHSVQLSDQQNGHITYVIMKGMSPGDYHQDSYSWANCKLLHIAGTKLTTECSTNYTKSVINVFTCVRK